MEVQPIVSKVNELITAAVDAALEERRPKTELEKAMLRTGKVVRASTMTFDPVDIDQVRLKTEVITVTVDDQTLKGCRLTVLSGDGESEPVLIDAWKPEDWPEIRGNLIDLRDSYKGLQLAGGDVRAVWYEMAQGLRVGWEIKGVFDSSKSKEDWPVCEVRLGRQQPTLIHTRQIPALLHQLDRISAAF